MVAEHIVKIDADENLDFLRLGELFPKLEPSRGTEEARHGLKSVEVISHALRDSLELCEECVAVLVVEEFSGHGASWLRYQMRSQKSSRIERRSKMIRTQKGCVWPSFASERIETPMRKTVPDSLQTGE